MKFDVILSDPAWTFDDSLAMSSVPRGADANYSTMSIADIAALPVKEVTADDGAVLAMWVPSSMLTEGLHVMKSWGFEQKQTLIWVKTKKEKSLAKLSSSNLNDSLGFGMGRLFRQCHELCLIGISSTKVYKKLKNKSQRSSFLASNDGHSIKPNHLHESLGKMFDGPKLEMYARRLYPGWTTIGNEVCGGEDIRTSLEELAKKE